MQPDWEGMAAPIVCKDKFTRMYYRLQLSNEERASVEEAGLHDPTPGRRTKKGFPELTAIANSLGISVHWALGLEYDDLLYGKAPFTDLIIDYYLILPEYVKPVVYSVIKKLAGGQK